MSVGGRDVWADAVDAFLVGPAGQRATRGFFGLLIVGAFVAFTQIVVRRERHDAEGAERRSEASDNR